MGSTREEDIFRSSIPPGPNFQHFYQAAVSVTVGTEGRAGEAKKMGGWEDEAIHPAVRANLGKMGLLPPTPVQAYAAPHILAGSDVVAISETGSGKTAAYLVPLISRLLRDHEEKPMGEGPLVRAVLILPARELAVQLFTEAFKLSYGTPLRLRLVYGGKPIQMQRHHVSRGADLLIATPGRLCDFIGRDWLKMDELAYLAVDEADQIVSKTFMAEVENSLLAKCPDLGHVQVLFVSATFPESLQSLVATFVHPEFVFVQTGKVLGANADVEQNVELATDVRDKDELLVQLVQRDLERYRLAKDEDGHFLLKTIVFVNSIPTLNYVKRLLAKEKIPTARPIHSHMSQTERELDLEDFRLGRVPVLIGTDVVARGIDIRGVDHVINFDLPAYGHEGVDMAMAQYVQRIGRTGRVGHKGRATAFFCPQPRFGKPHGDDPLHPHLLRVLRDSRQVVSPWMLRHSPRLPDPTTTASDAPTPSSTASQPTKA